MFGFHAPLVDTLACRVPTPATHFADVNFTVKTKICDFVHIPDLNGASCSSWYYSSTHIPQRGQLDGQKFVPEHTLPQSSKRHSNDYKPHTIHLDTERRKNRKLTCKVLLARVLMDKFKYHPLTSSVIKSGQLPEDVLRGGSSLSQMCFLSITIGQLCKATGDAKYALLYDLAIQQINDLVTNLMHLAGTQGRTIYELKRLLVHNTFVHGDNVLSSQGEWRVVSSSHHRQF